MQMQFTRKEKILLALMASIQFSHIVDFMIMMPLGPQLMRMFEISPKSFGLLVSSYTFAAGISGFFASFFIDRFDRKRALLFFYLGFGISTVACSLAPNYEYLLASRSLAGLFGGVLGSLVLSIVSDAINYERRGSAMGLVMGAFSVASVFGVPLSLFLATRFSWHAPFMFLGLISVVVALMCIFLVPSMRGHIKTTTHNPWDSLAHIFKTPNQQIGLLFMFCLVMGQFTIIPFLSPSFVANAGLAEAQLPLVYLFGGICSMFAAPTVGRLSDRYGKNKVFSVSVLASILPIWLITNMTTSPLWIVLGCSCIFFVAMSGRMVPAMAMISSTATPEYRGSFMSISSSVQNMSAALASWLAGQIVTKDDLGHLLHYPTVGYIAIGFSVLAYLATKKIQAGVA